jgi:hypothetical protein
MLAALSAPLEEQAQYLAEIETTDAACKPLYFWLAAHRSLADDGTLAIRLAEQGRDALDSRKALKVPHYAWSIAESDLEARLLDVLSRAHLDAGDPSTDSLSAGLIHQPAAVARDRQFP